ncbi:MAG: CPBP family intramembrane metalloprotease [Oscillospiraceae bacterium]|nr:CPBP family intramembrane metalloprotease [Oscillospiraceae bacterium]
MDEQNNAALPVEPAAETKKKRRPIRHMIWAVCLIALLIVLLGQIVGDFLVGFAIKGFGITDASTLFLFMYLSMIGVDLLVLLYTLLCERPIFRSFGRRAVPGGRGNTWKLFGVGLLAGFAMNALCILVAWLHGDIVLSVGRFRPLYLLAALVCVCVQSGAEELVTRGYMMGAIRDRYNVWVAAAVNSLFFGALHLLNPGITVLSFVNVVAVGFALSVVMIKLESLWFCIAMHTAWNFSQSIFFGLPNSGIVSEGSFFHLEAARDSVLYSAAFGVEGAITTTLVLLALTLCVLLAARRGRA